MREVLLFAAIAAGGWAFTRRLAPGRTGSLPAVLAVPLGSFLWAVCAILLMVVGLAPASAVPVFAAACAAWGLHACWREPQARVRVQFALMLLAVAAVAALAARRKWLLLSFDSVEQIATGRSLAAYGWIGDLGVLLASWGGLVPLVQGAGVGVGVDVLHAYQPLMALSLFAFCAWAAWQLAAQLKAAAAAVTLLVLVSCYFVLFQGHYVHNSLPSALFLGGAVLLFGLAWQRGEALLLRIAFVCLAAFCLCRTEAPLFAALALVLGAGLAAQGSLGPAYARLATLFAAAIAAWYLVLALVIGAGSDIMTPGRLGILVAVLGAAWAGTILLVRLPLPRLRACVPELIIAVCVAAVAAATVWQPAHMLQNVNAILGNLFGTGRWGLGWAALVLAAPFAWRRSDACRALLAFALGFAALVLLLGMARVPYRVGWGDSANRIFTHLWPLLVVAVSAGAASFRLQLPRASLPRQLGLALGSSLVVGFCCAMLVLSAGNVAPQARVVQAQDFCPPDRAGRYDFAVALRPPPGRSSTYAAACGSGPRDVVLELPKARRLRHVYLHEYGKEQAWQDFGVSTSADGKTWTTQYDSRNPALQGAARRLTPVQLRVDLGGEQVKFVRIEFRSALGQNRLLLHRLAIY